jgi:hypothetical protein
VADLPHEDRRPALHGQRLLAEGADIDSWEEGFDNWTPRTESLPSDDTGVDVDKEALLRLARELAGQRHAEQDEARVELESLKHALRERAEAVALRERELAELKRRLDDGKAPKAPKPAKPDRGESESLAARERAALERARALEARERELAERQAGLEAEAARVSERERDLAAELAAAQTERGESESERRLAAAERERLEEREQEARRIEKDLAARRVELDDERDRLEARARALETQLAALERGGDREPDPPPSAGDEGRERELRRLEAKLETRERELALIRQGLDAERNALLERERALRRREVADVRRSFDAPLVPPSFSEGLAALARARGRN